MLLLSINEEIVKITWSAIYLIVSDPWLMMVMLNCWCPLGICWPTEVRWVAFHFTKGDANYSFHMRFANQATSSEAVIIIMKTTWPINLSMWGGLPDEANAKLQRTNIWKVEFCLHQHFDAPSLPLVTRSISRKWVGPCKQSLIIGAFPKFQALLNL